MSDPVHAPVTRLKIAIVEAIMRNTPGLRAIQREREIMRAQLDGFAAEIAELRSERDALLRGMALLLEEKALGRAG